MCDINNLSAIIGFMNPETHVGTKGPLPRKIIKNTLSAIRGTWQALSYRDRILTRSFYETYKSVRAWYKIHLKNPI